MILFVFWCLCDGGSLAVCVLGSLGLGFCVAGSYCLIDLQLVGFNWFDLLCEGLLQGFATVFLDGLLFE